MKISFNFLKVGRPSRISGNEILQCNAVQLTVKFNSKFGIKKRLPGILDFSVLLKGNGKTIHLLLAWQIHLTRADKVSFFQPPLTLPPCFRMNLKLSLPSLGSQLLTLSAHFIHSIIYRWLYLHTDSFIHWFIKKCCFFFWQPLLNLFVELSYCKYAELILAWEELWMWCFSVHAPLCGFPSVFWTPRNLSECKCMPSGKPWSAVAVFPHFTQSRCLCHASMRVSLWVTDTPVQPVLWTSYWHE